MTIQGLHHVSLIANDAQRTVDFYTRTLGLRLVKKTVNYGDPGAYHLYFGDATGSPGSIVTFFIMPGAQRGRTGLGGTHHVALTVEDGRALRKWKRRLTDEGIRVKGPFDRHYFESVYFRDPDGAILELATRGPGWAVDEPVDALGAEQKQPPAVLTTRNRDRERIAADTHPGPVPEVTPDMALTRGMHHTSALGADNARAHAFYGDLLGMRLLKRTGNFDAPDMPHWSWGVGDGVPGTIVTYFELDPERTAPARMGAGQTHHVALSVPDEAAQLEASERLANAGHRVSPVMDRSYFKSVYSSDPDGHVVEIATAGPGFTVDEAEEELGTKLMLPAWLEARREEIEEALPPLSAPEWRDAGVPGWVQ